MKRKKKILVYPESKKLHSLYKPLIRHLDNHYNLIHFPPQEIKVSFLKKWIKKFNCLKFLYYKLFKNFFKFKNTKKLIIPENDLIFSLNSIPPGEGDYILDLEYVSALSGYNHDLLKKDFIEEELNKDRCKAIICWNYWSEHSLKKYLSCSKFEKKIKVIPFSYNFKEVKKISHDGINFLFVSSINNPDDFEFKGGLIVLESFKRLLEHKKFSNLNLFIRSNVKKRIKNRYSSTPNIIFLDELNDLEMEELFLSSDFLLEPLPGINLILECINYEILPITFDCFWIPEIIKNKNSGFLINSEEIFGNIKDTKKYLKDLRLNYFKLINKKFISKYSDKFKEVILDLIDSKMDYALLAKKSKKEICNGPYSSGNREKEISKIIDFL